MTMRKALVLWIGLLPALSGCGDDWFGEPEGPPLPGDRVSVLVHDNALSPDRNAANAQVVLPKPEPTPDWPQTGGFSHHAMVHVPLSQDPQRAWSTNIGTGADSENSLIASPVIAEGMVFAIDASARVSAYDTEKGRRQWRYDLTPDGGKGIAVRGGGIAYDDGRLFAATGAGELWALDAKTGGFFWKVRLDSPLRAAPTIYGGRVFVVTASNRVVAYAALDGRKLWEFTGQESVEGLLGAASPAADLGVVVVAMRSGALAALRVENGSLAWEDSLAGGRRASGTSSIGDIKAPPVIAGGRVFAVGNSGLSAAIDLRTGGRIWEKEIGGVNMPWVAGNFLFVLSNDSEVVALQANSGRIVWVTPLSTWLRPDTHSGRIIWTGPVLAGDRLIVAGSHGYIVAVSPYTGKVLGYDKLPGGVTVPPVAAGGSLYFLTDDADLVAYR
jgi:outer membrane protein assembly factor BamB